MSYEVDKYDLLFQTSIPISDYISFKNPTVEEVAKGSNFTKYSSIFVTSTREMFSQFPEVDELELRYPTIRSILIDKEMQDNNFLGMYFGEGKVTGKEILFESLEYWTGIKQEKFKLLANGKIICTSPEWIIDEEEFKNIAELVSMITSYEPNSDFIAPLNMTPTRHKVWMNMYKGRLKRLKRSKGTLADKILVLSISNNSYLPINEIRKMTYFHFCKLSILLSEKEGYELRWMLNASPNFETDTKIAHWKETII